MSDEDEAFDQDEDDEIEAAADDTADIDVEDVDEVEDVVEDDEEQSGAIAAKPVSRAAARSESPEAHSIEARDKVRKSLAADVEAFLARGGSIQTISEDQRTETPKKPDSSFGRRSV